LLSVSPALTFYLTHVITSAALPKSSREKPSSVQTFLVNAAGNAGSTALLFPLILSKTRLQWRSPSGRKMYKSLMDVLRKTVKRNGIAGETQDSRRDGSCMWGPHDSSSPLFFPSPSVQAYIKASKASFSRASSPMALPWSSNRESSRFLSIYSSS
jgi:hypothetical protein